MINALLIILILNVLVSTAKETGYGKTQKRYERKAVLSTKSLISVGNRIDVKAIICPKGGVLCIPIGKWTFSPDNTLKDKIRETLMSWVLAKRYDKIIIGKDSIILITAQNRIEKDIDPIKVKDSQDYLAHVVTNLMKDSLEVRYKELPYEKQELFINTKAKELGIPAEIIESLMSSSFMFSFHVEDIDVSMIFHKEKVGKGKGKFDLYTTSIVSKSTVRLDIYRLDPEKRKYEHYKSIKSSGTYSYTESFPFLPASLFHIEETVKRSILLSIKSSAINLNNKLREDDNFAIFSVVTDVEGKSLFAEIGILEDLRVDAPFLIYRYENGEKKEIGILKARKVENNCEKPANSMFEIIKGRAEIGDSIREVPWSGVFFDIGYKNSGMSFEGIWEGSVINNSLILGAKADLGYILNSEAFSEIWMTVYILLDFGKAEIYNRDLKKTFYGNMGASGDLRIGKRFYIFKTGSYLEPGASWSFGKFGLSSSDGTNLDISFSHINFYIEGGFTVSPKFELFFGGSVPLLKTAEFDLDPSPLFYTPPPVDKFTTSTSVYAGVRFGIPSFGFFSKIYAKSKECKE